jgi:hypothetical protein
VTAYSPAPEVERIAKKLIAKYHRHLNGEEIRYVFRDEHANSKGKVVAGKARLIGGFTAWLASSEPMTEMQEADKFFVIEIAADVWNALGDDQRTALVDHELCHCVIDVEKSQLGLIGHDVEEFADVLARHGLWRPEIEAFVKASAQGRFVFEEGSRDD